MKFYNNHKQLVRHILCIVIPSRSLRHKIISILKSDDSVAECLRRSRALRMADRQFCKTHPNMPLWAICAIVKNEGCYLQEWIEYYKIHGVDKIYIYDNESTDDTQSVLKPYIQAGLVEYKFFPGLRQQVPAYQDCIATHGHDVRWIAFVDLDEFIVPSKRKTISDVLKSVPKNVGQISMGWLFFGSNGHINKPDGLVIENYTRRARRARNFKSIVNPRVLWDAFVHQGIVANKTWFPRHKQLKVNHYYCKSWQEYSRRKNRGDAFYGPQFAQTNFNKADFDRQDSNDVLDTDILRYLADLKNRVQRTENR